MIKLAFHSVMAVESTVTACGEVSFGFSGNIEMKLTSAVCERESERECRSPRLGGLGLLFC